MFFCIIKRTSAYCLLLVARKLSFLSPQVFTKETYPLSCPWDMDSRLERLTAVLKSSLERPYSIQTIVESIITVLRELSQMGGECVAVGPLLADRVLGESFFFALRLRCRACGCL